MSIVTEIHQQTLELYRYIQSQEKVENRDIFVDKVTAKIEKRQNLMNRMNPPYSDEEKVLGQEITSLDEEINQHLSFVLSAIKRDIGLLNKSRMTRNKYDSPYENVYRDGTFLDKRN